MNTWLLHLYKANISANIMDGGASVSFYVRFQLPVIYYRQPYKIQTRMHLDYTQTLSYSLRGVNTVCPFSHGLASLAANITIIQARIPI